MSSGSSSSYDSPFKASCLNDRVALITGGGSGIGLEITRQLAAHGAKVLIMGRRDAVLQAAINKLVASGIPSSSLGYVSGDVRKSEDAAKAVSATVEKFGKLNVLINGAAGNFLTPAELLSSNGFRTVLDIDTVGTFTMCQAAFQELKKNHDAHIINISAVLHYGATWYQVHSSAAKAAIDSVTASLALEWGEYNIRVNTIAPGPIADTPGFSKLGGDLAGSSKAAEEALTATVPLKRAGLKLDIGLAVVYLVSKAGNYISGAHLVIDGGSWFGKPPLADRDIIVQFSRKAEKTQKQKATGQIAHSKL